MTAWKWRRDAGPAADLYRAPDQWVVFYFQGVWWAMHGGVSVRDGLTKRSRTSTWPSAQAAMSACEHKIAGFKRDPFPRGLMCGEKPIGEEPDFSEAARNFARRDDL